MYIQVRVECQSLRERLKVLQDTQQHDVGTLEDRIAELQLQLDEVRTYTMQLALSQALPLLSLSSYHAASFVPGSPPP